MSNKVWVGVGSLAIIGVLVLGAAQVSAATDRYNFIIRGIITEIDTESKTITVDVTAAPGKAFDDLSSKSQVFQVKDTKFFKREGTKDKRVTLSRLAVGQELGIKGVAKNDDKYYITWLRIHDRTFSVVGELNEHLTDTKTLKIYITHSSYKPGKFQKSEVTMTYDDNSKFKNNSGGEVVFDDVDANNQRVKVTGTVTGTNTWEVSTLSDGYTKTK
jgi:FlaG/FlaF family flagellin (archaellin)